MAAALEKQKGKKKTLKRAIDEEQKKALDAVVASAEAMLRADEAVSRADRAEAEMREYAEKADRALAALKSAEDKAQSAVADYKSSEAFKQELIRAGTFSYGVGCHDMFKKIQINFEKIDFSRFRPPYEETEGDDFVEVLSSGSSEENEVAEASVQVGESSRGPAEDVRAEEVPVQGDPVPPVQVEAEPAEEGPAKPDRAEETSAQGAPAEVSLAEEAS